ncbi:UNVERIFIED_CONTAM: putative 6-phosphogluconolactonase 2 [Sesamum radiatum]|uniref:6-phosphogluconolactonase 2 n=1 Tax=Sesamum radiatum TaxID=300843 RepID=A0AAW2TVZ4_SESRA
MALLVDRTAETEMHILENADDMRSDLAEYIAELSEASIKERGVFAVALSGGSLISFMGKLSEAPYNKTVDWAKWYIFWADERVVAKTHVDSNYKLVKDGLLSKVNTDTESFFIGNQIFHSILRCNLTSPGSTEVMKVPIVHSHVHSINDSVTAEKAAEDYEFVIRQLVRTRVINVSEINDCPRFDLVLLEMGPDGDVGSLFPNHPVLKEKEQWVTFITDSPKPPPERITFTLPVVNSASNVVVVATGRSKADIVRLVFDEFYSELPARMVQPINGKLAWFMDQGAASKIGHKS